MKAIITQLLEMNTEEYHKMVFNHFHQWCNFRSFDGQDCQNLMTSQALYEWWCQQYSSLERKFASKSMEFFGKTDRQTLMDLHTEYIINTQDFYSKPLMRAARKKQPITPQLN